MQIDHVPEELRARPQWVVWRAVQREEGKKPTKVPFCAATGEMASSTNPETWGTFEAALRAAEGGSHAGVGFALSPDDPYVAWDLDGCMEDGVLAEWAAKIAARLDSYTEVSPSGQGLRIFCKGALPPGGRKKGHVECYDRARYMTVTGNWINTTPRTIEERTEQMAALHEEVFAERAPEPEPARPAPSGQSHGAGMSDAELLDLARRAKNGEAFAKLWKGDWQGDYPSQSEADMALCMHLAFWCGGDRQRMDRMFRDSGLMRRKWDRSVGQGEHYGQRTIRMARAQVTDHYDGHRQPSTRQPAHQRTAEPTQPAPEKPTIWMDQFELADLTRQAVDSIRAANKPESVFVRAAGLCRVLVDETGSPKISSHSKASIRHRMAQCALYCVHTRSETKMKPPPDPITESVLSLGRWPLPALQSVVTSPFLRPDGSICDRPGYDRATQTYYVRQRGLVVPAVPDHPTTRHVEDARTAIDDVLQDFPFSDASGRAHAYAVLLSVVARAAIPGPVPMCIIAAPTQGTGKSLLARVLGVIAAGHLSVHAPPGGAKGDDEWRKRIMAILLDAPQMVLIDNLPETEVLDSPSLACMLTSSPEDGYTDRILGRTEQVRVPCHTVWLATGNHVRIRGDIPRRTFWLRLDASLERPWERTGFAHPDIEGYARSRRGALLHAALTIARHWWAAGQPMADTRAHGGFESWTTRVGGMLACAGIDGFMANSDAALGEADDDGEQWRAFFAAWRETYGDSPVSSADLCDALTHGDLEPIPDPLLSAMDRGENSLRRSMGRYLGQMLDRVFDDAKLTRAGSDRSKRALWRLESAGFAGSAGSVHPDGTAHAHARARNAACDDEHTPHSPHSPREQWACPNCGSTDTWDIRPGQPACVHCCPPRGSSQAANHHAEP